MKKRIRIKERILFALDVQTVGEALHWVELLGSYVGGFKVGLELITTTIARLAMLPTDEALQELLLLRKFAALTKGRIFWDGKFDDIPNTIKGAMVALGLLEPMIANVHVSAGSESVKAAVANKGKSMVFGVTVLTTIKDECVSIFGDNPGPKVLAFADKLVATGADGMICSGEELKALKDPKYASLLKAIPGIRPAWAAANDQKRIVTPYQAITDGADYLVIGRPIADAADPIEAVKRIEEEIREALADMGYCVDILGMGKEELLQLEEEDVLRLLTVEEFKYIAKTLGALWEYDYEALKEGRFGLHALLKSGMHGDVFFNSAAMLVFPNICRLMASQIVRKITPFLGGEKPYYVLGIPKGATELGRQVADIFGSVFIEMEKIGDDMVINCEIEPDKTVLVIEDFCTAATGFKQTIPVILAAQPRAIIYPYDVVMLNRGGLKYTFVEGVHGAGMFMVIAVVESKEKTWESDNCILCVAGSEPIKPKATEENWVAINVSQIPAEEATKEAAAF